MSTCGENGSNVFRIFPKTSPQSSKNEKQENIPTGIRFGQIIKANDLNDQSKPISVRSHQSAEFLGKRFPLSNTPLLHSSNMALNQLKRNFKNLNELHARLRFMLRELEELVGK